MKEIEKSFDTLVKAADMIKDSMHYLRFILNSPIAVELDKRDTRIAKLEAELSRLKQKYEGDKP